MSIEITQATIPTVPGLPLIGNLLDYRFNRLDLMLRMSRKSGDIAAFHLGSRTVVMLNTSELVHAALVDHASDFEKTPGFRIHGRPLLGNGLLTSQNDVHTRHRRLVAPPFQHRRIDSSGDILVRASAQLKHEG